MEKIVLFAEQTPGEKEIEERFSPIEKEIAELTQEIHNLEDRRKDAEAILAVVDTETQNRMKKFRQSLVDGDTAVSRKIPDELKKINEKTFEAQSLIEGLTPILAEKRGRLESLSEQLKEKPVLFHIKRLYSLYDQYNKHAAALGAVIKEMHEVNSLCRRDSAVGRFGGYLQRVGHMPESLPVLHFDGNKVRNKSENFFWNSTSHHHKK